VFAHLQERNETTSNITKRQVDQFVDRLSHHDDDVPPIRLVVDDGASGPDDDDDNSPWCYRCQRGHWGLVVLDYGTGRAAGIDRSRRRHLRNASDRSAQILPTTYKGHRLILVNTGVGISNTAITTTLLLTQFPSVTRLIGSGVAGDVDPSLRVGDVIVPEKWAMYQHQVFAKEVAPGVYEPPGFELDILVGPNCGGFDGLGTYLTGPTACNVTAG
jgi:Phosphorylase superfamily